MKQLTIKTKGIITFVASTGLSLYSLYEIIRILSIAIKPYVSIYRPFDKVLFFLNSSINDWGFLALGLCGLVLVYADWNIDKDMDFQNRIAKIKKTVFSAFLIFSVGYIFEYLYLLYSSFQAIAMAKAAGQDVEHYTIPIIAITIIGAVLGAFHFTSKILLGAYLISRNDRLMKPFWIIYIIGFAYTMITSLFGLINGSMMLAESSQLIDAGLTQPNGFRLIFSFVKNILILAAELIVILYATNKVGRLNLRPIEGQGVLS